MKLEIEVEPRHRAGKGGARHTRRNGKIPAVLYGQGQSRLLAIAPKFARDAIVAKRGHMGLLAVRIKGGDETEERYAVLQDYQRDPITGAILHIDLFEVAMDKPLRVKIPVTLVGGMPVGVKAGGVLQNPLREVLVECLPGDIPDHLEVNVAGLEVGQGIAVKDLAVPSGVRVLEDPEAKIAAVASKISEAKLEALLTREEAGVSPGETEAIAQKSKAGETSGSTESKEAK